MKIYFSGISGVAIGPLALMATDLGYEVVGSDLSRSNYFDELEARGAKTYEAQDGSQIADEHQTEPIDWFVMTSALPNDHPELQFARDNGIRISKRDELINHILDEKNLKMLAVAGSHGKTTTTSMLIWLFNQLEIPLSYSVGTTLSFGPSATYQEGSEYFVYEADEFDHNFLKFTPFASIITSLDFDHPDTYPDKEAYNQAFADFLEATLDYKSVWSDDQQELPDYIIDECTILEEANSEIDKVELTGRHNRQNAHAAIALFKKLFPDYEKDQLHQVLSKFPGSGRRFEKLADNLYTDYAHHPVEIKATLQMALELNDQVVIVYQPHQNKRQQEIIEQGGYIDAFSGAKKVFWLPTYLSREPNENIIDPQTLIKTMTEPDLTEISEMGPDLVESIKAELESGALVLGMSAGDLDQWLRTEFKA